MGGLIISAFTGESYRPTCDRRVRTYYLTQEGSSSSLRGDYCQPTIAVVIFYITGGFYHPTKDRWHRHTTYTSSYYTILPLQVSLKIYNR